MSTVRNSHVRTISLNDENRGGKDEQVEGLRGSGKAQLARKGEEDELGGLLIP